MNKTWLLLITIFFSYFGASDSFALPLYNPATDHTYEIVSSGENGAWINAENNAIALGGHLVTINDADEEMWLRTNFGFSTSYWIGYNDAAVEGIWVWSSGESATYTHWASGEPNNSTPPTNGEDFAVLNYNTSTGAWNDSDHQRPQYSYISGIAEVVAPEPVSSILFVTGSVFLGGRRLLKRKKTGEAIGSGSAS